MERDFLVMYSKNLPPEAKSSDKSKMSGGEVEWPFSISSSVFLPVKHGMPPNYVAADNYLSRKILSDSLSTDSSTASAFNHCTPCFTKNNIIVPRTCYSAMKQKSQVGAALVPNSLSISPSNGLGSNGCGDLHILKPKRQNDKSVTASPLTICYSGMVHVYHDVPPAKAEFIMCVAGDGQPTDDGMKNSSNSNQQLGENSSIKNKKKPPLPTPTSHYASEIASSTTIAQSGPNMARKATLARFLEKRKDR